MGRLSRRARSATRILRTAPGFSTAVVLALAVGIGFGMPMLGIARGAGLRSARYVDPLLREGGQATGWLPGGTASRQTIAASQHQALQALLGVLLAFTVLLVAIALVNVLTLLLARAAARRPEVALRAALGARPPRLIGHFSTEGVILLLLGGGSGMLIGVGVGSLLRRSRPAGIPSWGDSVADGWSAVVVLVFALVFLLAWISPVGVAWRRDLRRFLATGGRSTVGRRETITRQTLAVVQIACSIVLLTGAGLLLRGFAFSSQQSRAPGFDPRDTLTVQVRLPRSLGSSAGKQSLPLQQMRERIAALPGVLDTSVTTPGAWVGLGATDRVSAICLDCWVMGHVIKPVSDGRAQIHAVSPGTFAALGAPVLRGRELGPSDTRESPGAAVINDTFAGRLFPHGDALGKRIQVGGRKGRWYTVVGIVDGIRARGIGIGDQPVPAVYLSTLQNRPTIVNLAVRTTGDPMGLLPVVEHAVHSVAPGARLTDAMTMEQRLARFRAPLRWFGVLFGVLAGGALLLATSGLQAVLSHHVARRTREIGIRMALGAQVSDVTRMILRQSLRIVGVGAALSLFGALALARLLQLLLAGADPFDPLLFGGIVVLLGSIALLASHRPARRAAVVDPQISLGSE